MRLSLLNSKMSKLKVNAKYSKDFHGFTLPIYFREGVVECGLGAQFPNLYNVHSPLPFKKMYTL